MLEKIRRKLWGIIVSRTKSSKFYFYIYKSYWHSTLFSQGKLENHFNYFSAIPNPGAGIGHQMANWIAGYWFARQFGLQFAHIPFSKKNWEEFLGFGSNEVLVETLVNNQGYKSVRLPLFKEDNDKEINLIKKIITSYSNKKVVFVAEQDQYYENQYGNIKELKEKFYTAESRKNNTLVYEKDNFNIAIHIRRGDIVIGKNKNPNHTMRWQHNEYFEKVLEKVLHTLKTDKKIVIYVFSQGIIEDFKTFNRFPNLILCLDMGAQESFLHMVYADVLITSKSSFSYKPALLNNGIKVCPENFWHKYPKNSDWIMVDDNGNLQ